MDKDEIMGTVIKFESNKKEAFQSNMLTHDYNEDTPLFDNGDTLADLFKTGIFTKEQRSAIKAGLAEITLSTSYETKQYIAKIYYMSDYRH